MTRALTALVQAWLIVFLLTAVWTLWRLSRPCRRCQGDRSIMETRWSAPDMIEWRECPVCGGRG